MDQGAHFYRCDFQVHSPRDTNWRGKRPTNELEREEYAARFVSACRQKGLNAVAITDHHDLVYFPYIKQAAAQETDANGNVYPTAQQLVVFPGMELTLGVPCQALLILDANFPEDLLTQVYGVLAITTNAASEEKHQEVQVLEHLQNLKELFDRLNEPSWLRNRFILLPNVSDGGNFTVMREKFKAHYKHMPCVGGYLDGPHSKLGPGKLRIYDGKDHEYGSKSIGVIPTSDNRRDDFADLGLHSAWIKWSEPSAEALRQACLARTTRILHAAPALPSVVIESLEVSNSRFLGPIDLEFNAQYNSFIGGRGTGKSTLLEYLRWGLCDQPIPIDIDDIPDFQEKRSSLIEHTLMPLQAVVTVRFALNGVSHVVRRESATGNLQLKLPGEEFRVATEEEIRDLLPVRAYSQKQLSAVGVRTEELVRFIEAPIRKELGDLASKVADLRRSVRTSYTALQRVRAIDREIAKDELEASSLQKQIDAIRKTLTGLDDTDKGILERHDKVLAEEQLIEAWQRDFIRLEESVRHVTEELGAMPRRITDRSKLHSVDRMSEMEQTATAVVREVSRRLNEILAVLRPDSDGVQRFAVLRSAWQKDSATFSKEYEAIKAKASSQEAQLKQCAIAEQRLRVVRQQIEVNRDKKRAAGDDPLQVYRKAKQQWREVYSGRADLVQAKCAELTKLSDGRIRATLRRGAGTQRARERLTELLTGTGARRRFDDLFDFIQSQGNPAEAWEQVLTDLESLIDWQRDEPTTDLPLTPLLSKAGFNEKELQKVAAKLDSDSWLELSLIELDDTPRFEYRQRETTYIEFKDASAGQQATALLRVLLHQDGPPLVIDQPEDDLDNQVVLAIVEDIWKAKMRRQLIFSSHNANLVVNGDADLVVLCDYRNLSDQSLGKIEDQGAIDVERIRKKITEVMEGGKEAFRMRKEKYGF